MAPMPMEVVRIRITELPPRAHALSAEKIAALFGGTCSGQCQSCSCDEDCCAGWKCLSRDINANCAYKSDAVYVCNTSGF